MIRSKNKRAIMFLSIFFINIFVLSIPIQDKNFLGSNELLNMLGITEKQEETYHVVPLLRGTTPVNLTSGELANKGSDNSAGETLNAETTSVDIQEIDLTDLPINFQVQGSGDSYGFVWLDYPVEVDLGATYGSWVENQDLSVYGVPSTATGVILAWDETSPLDRHAVARGSEDPNDYMNGSSIYSEFEDATWRMQIVKLGSNLYIDTWRESDRELLYVMGFTVGTDPNFRTIPTDLGSLIANSTWNKLHVADVDVNTTGVILLGQSFSSVDSTILVRSVGSTDDMIPREWEEYNIGMLLVKIDSTDEFEYYISSGTQAKFYLIAEVENSIDWLTTNRIDISANSSETTHWTLRDLDDYLTVPTNASGVILQHESSSSSSTDTSNIARKYGQTSSLPKTDVGSGRWLIGGIGIDSENRFEIYAEEIEQHVFIHAITILVDKSPPVIINFNVEEIGNGTSIFWADIFDQEFAVKNVTLKVNGTEYTMSYNGTYWINTSVHMVYGNFYNYTITNTSDFSGNFLTTLSTVKNRTISKDIIFPVINEWQFIPDGTFLVNASDPWGKIDKVLVNITYYGGSPRSDAIAIMRLNATGYYINNTLTIPPGEIYFTFLINDTAGNKFVSDEYQGYKGTNEKPEASNLILSPDPVHSNESLSLSYVFNDVHNDSEGGTEIRWYKNAVLQSSLNGSEVISSLLLIRGDQWNVSVRPKDGQIFGDLEWSNTTTVLNSAPYVINYMYTMGNPAIPGVLIENEDLNISYSFNDVDHDADKSVLTWYINNESKPQYDGLKIISADKTHKGETWRVEIYPYDGNETGRMVYLIIFIESRPAINSYNFVSLNDTEGHYEIIINATDSRNEIQQIEFWFSLNSTEELPPFIITSPNSESSDIWILDYLLTDHSYLNTTAMLTITVVSLVIYSEIGYEIECSQLFNVTIRDLAPPRIIDAWFEKDNERNPTNLTFYANVQDYGEGITDVILYYYFRPVSSTNESGGNGASLYQDEQWLQVPMVFQYENIDDNLFFYSVTVKFEQNKTDFDIIYLISTLDLAGNSNPEAFDIRKYPQLIQRIIYQPSGLPTWILWFAVIAVLLTFVSAVIYVKFIRKPEIVGLDKELVMKGVPEIVDDEIFEHIDQHSLGVVVSFFDQRHGPIPIIIIPEMLKDNFDKLVALSDRSFSGTGFSDDFESEVPSSYDFVLGQSLRISVISFGFALDKPEARGGKENLTINILLQKEVFKLVSQFQDEIHKKVHEFHMLMVADSSNKDVIRMKANEVRKFVTKIILSYVDIYGSTELIEEEE